MIPSELFSDALIYAVGWTIVHTLWQGALVAGVLAVALACMRSCAPNTRYLLSATGLLLIAGMAVPTFISLYTPASTSHTVAIEYFVDTQLADRARPHAAMAEAATAPGDSAATLRTWLDAGMPAVVMIWLAGMFFFTVKFLAEFAYTNRMRYRETVAPSTFWKCRCDELCHMAGVRTSIDLVESALVQVPVVIGALKPMILLPLGTLAGLPAQQVEAILAHELAHIRRHDYLVNILQTLVSILFFYHPAVWWLSSRMRIEREHCCDDIAVAISGSPMALAKALAGLQERALAPRTAMAATGDKKHYLLHRIRRIAGQPGQSSTPVERGVAVCVLVAALLVVGLNTRSSFASATDTHATVEDSTKAQTPYSTSASVHPSQPVSLAVTEQPDSYQISIFLNTGPNGTPQRIEAVIDNRNEIQELSIDGKKVPPSEFGKYKAILNEAKQDHDEAIEDAEEASRDAEEASRNAEEASRDAEEASRDAEEASREAEEASRDAEEQAHALEIQSEAWAKEIERNAEAWEKEIERSAEAWEKEMEALYDQPSANKKQLDSLLQISIKQFQKSVEAFSKQVIPTDQESYRKYIQQYQKSIQEFSQQLAESTRQMKQKAREQKQQARSKEREENRRKSDSTRAQAQAERALRQEKQQQEFHKRRAALESELLNDKLIANVKKYDFKMTATELTIDGKKQPQSVLEKYKKFFNAQKEFDTETTIRIRKSEK